MVDPASPVTSAKPIRVFILDDHELVRRGLTDLLTAANDLILVGEAATAADVEKLVAHIQQVVHEKFGVALTPEFRIAGELP